jgi:cation diffusion facilitator family transporter
VADRPADAEHPYGHGKVENLTALAETGLLLVTCGWIVYEAIQRLFFRTVAIQADVWGIAVMVLSIGASLALSTYLMRIARRYRSQSLEGNALNFRTDVLSSSVVLLGLLLVGLSEWLGPEWAWLQKADAVSALVVALMVLRVSLTLGWHALGHLLDAAPPGLADKIAEEAAQVPGVQTVGPVRVRLAGAFTFADLSVSVARSVSLEEAHRVATDVERAVRQLIHQGDVIVHVDPVRQRGESLPQTVYAIAARRQMRAHDIHAHEVRGRYYVDVHVEVEPDLTLAQAHAEVSGFEAAVRQELPYVSEVHTHIEPRSVPVMPAELEGTVDPALEEQILAVAESVTGLHGCHDVHARPGPDGYDVVLHCLAAPDLPIVKAHSLAEQVEMQLHARVPGIGQVLVHVEPEDEEE